MNRLLIILVTLSTVGCATLTEDAMTPIAFSFSDGSNGECQLQNKRGAWPTQIPTTTYVRKSDDALRYQCETNDGRKVTGAIPSEMGGKIIASAIFIDFGITDAITDKHRKYPVMFVIPIAQVESQQSNSKQISVVEQPAVIESEPISAVEITPDEATDVERRPSTGSDENITVTLGETGLDATLPDEVISRRFGPNFRASASNGVNAFWAEFTIDRLESVSLGSQDVEVRLIDSSGNSYTSDIHQWGNVDLDANLSNPPIKVGTYGFYVFSIPMDSTPASLSFTYEFKGFDKKFKLDCSKL